MQEEKFNVNGSKKKAITISKSKATNELSIGQTTSGSAQLELIHNCLIN